MANLNPQEKLAAARARACIKLTPYFSDVILGLIPRESPGLGTLAVTARMVLAWDPAWVETITVEELAWVLVHECGHVLRGHHKRCEAIGADPFLWNIAGDAEINDDLIAMGAKLPGKPVLPAHLDCKDGDIAETYYRALRQQAEDQRAGSSAGGKTGEGEGEGEGEGAGEKGEPSENGSGGEGKGKKGAGHGHGGKPCPGSGWCGSAAGRAVPGEPADGDGPGRSDIDQERIKMQVAEAIKREMQQGRGNIPGGWDAWADGMLKPPRVPWEQKLARALRGAVSWTAGRVDYTYARPSRRQAAVGYGPGRPILSSLRSPVPRVAVGVDTSGSMGEVGITRAASEIAGILKSVRAEVEFIACDCQVNEQRKVRNVKDLNGAFKGGGGTSFCPAFEALGKLKPVPSIFVFVTDGQGDAPKDPPKGVGRVIWVLVGPHRCKPEVRGGGEVEYGEFIEIEEVDAA